MPKLTTSEINEKYALFPICITEIDDLKERISLLKTFFIIWCTL